jgi:glutaredoxin
MRTQVLGLSVDSEPCLKAWADSLGGITYPLLSDFYPHGKVAEQYHVLRSEGYSERAIFVIDRYGIIRYIDIHAIDQQPDNDELFRVLGEIDPEAAADWKAQQPAPAREPAPEPQADVVMYCTSWCPSCRRAREFFKQRGVEFVEIDIGRDRDAAARVRGWANGNETTPTFNIHGQVIVSFDIDRVEEALGLKGQSQATD